MSVVANRSGGNAVVTITTDVSDLLAMPGVSPADKRRMALERVLDELRDAVAVHGKSDALIDSAVTQAHARADRYKAVRPTGNL